MYQIFNELNDDPLPQIRVWIYAGLGSFCIGSRLHNRKIYIRIHWIIRSSNPNYGLEYLKHSCYIYIFNLLNVYRIYNHTK